MTLLFIDGFDIYGSTQNSNINGEMEAGMWTDWTTAPEAVQETAVVRTGRGAVRINSGSGEGRKQVTAATTMTMGVGVYLDGNQGTQTLLKMQWVGPSTTTDLVKLRRQANTTWIVQNADSSTLVTTSTGLVTLDAWMYIEMQARANASTGEVIVRIDECEVARVSGVNTISSGITTFNQVAIGRDSTDAQVVYDDFYVLDDKGASNNDFLGPIQVQTLRPNGTGQVSQWTAVGGTATFSTVSEMVADDDNTYARASTLGNKDLYDVSSLVAGVTNVFGVMVVSDIKKETAGSNSIRLITRVSTTEASSAAKTVDTGYKFVSHLFETQPAGGAWTPAAVSAMEIGLAIVSTA